MQFSSIWPIDRTLPGATTTIQSGAGSNGNEGVLCIPQSSSITGTSLSNCLVSYSGHSLGESYPSAEQWVYSTAPANMAIIPVDMYISKHTLTVVPVLHCNSFLIFMTGFQFAIMSSFTKKTLTDLSFSLLYTNTTPIIEYVWYYMKMKTVNQFLSLGVGVYVFAFITIHS